MCVTVNAVHFGPKKGAAYSSLITMAFAIECAALKPMAQGPVAQWLEPAAHNRLVGGSSPPGPTNLFKDLQVKLRITLF